MPKTCPNCGTVNNDESRFCYQCGKEFVNFVCCPACGYQHPATDRFCTRCGRPADAAASAAPTEQPPVQGATQPAVASPLVFNVGDLSFRMIPVAGGTFMMGADILHMRYANDDETPYHQVTLDSFMIGETEVTQELWTAVMGVNPSHYRNIDNLPVDHVSWDDCQEFLEKLNAMTGQCFRLPTEAEWEFAARGGNMSRGYDYAGSNYLDDVAWYEENSEEMTHPVGTKKPNELGLYDMTGNVWEWCEDKYGEYSQQPQYNPKGASRGWERVMRGGGEGEFYTECRVTARSYDPESSDSNLVGLRLAL